MKEIKRIKDLNPSDIKIYAGVSIDQELMDYRPGRWGLSFGKVGDVCQQYGIACQQLPGGIEFSAPKLRMQMLIETLHFSRTAYSSR